jgi:integrase
MTKKKDTKPASIPVGRITVTPVLTRADGAWKWRAFWYENNETRSKVLGWFQDPDEAEAAGVQLLVDGLPEKAKKEEPALRFDTVKDLLESWIDAIDKRVGDAPGQLSQSTADQYDNRVGHLIGTVGIGDVSLGRITAATLSDYRDRRLAAGAAPSTVLQELVTLRIAWKHGRERGWCPNYELPGCDVQVEPVRNDHTPDRADVEAVLAKLSGWPLVAVLALATTGARISEVGNMLDEDLVIEEGKGRLVGWWNLRGRVKRRGKRVGKTGARVVPLRPELMSAVLALRALKAEKGPTPAPGWPSRPEYMLGVAPKTAKTSIEDVFLPRACAAAGVKPFTPHGLRRYFEDQLAEARVDIAEYAAILGHSPQTALEHYRRVRPVNLQRASDAVPPVAAPTPAKGSPRQPRAPSVEDPAPARRKQRNR